MLHFAPCVAKRMLHAVFGTSRIRDSGASGIPSDRAWPHHVPCTSLGQLARVINWWRRETRGTTLHHAISTIER